MQKMEFITHEEFKLKTLSNPTIQVIELWRDELKEWEKNQITLGELKINISDFVECGNFQFPSCVEFLFYPWRNAVVISLGKHVYKELVTVRNKYKISSDEQNVLGLKCVGIVGLSVGFQVVKALVMSNLVGRIKIADFDSVEISNLNRLDVGLFGLGFEKTELVYRWIKEQNPYIEVDIYEEGISAENLVDFIGGNHRLDVLIDECDSLLIKIKLREQAKNFQIPVVMHTSDRGMLDIENFKSSKSAFAHSLLKYSNLTEDEIKSNAGAIIADVCDLKNASERSVFSFKNIGTSLRSWPQLAEDVVSGGGNVATVVRLLLLGASFPSQRILLNPENFLEEEN